MKIEMDDNSSITVTVCLVIALLMAGALIGCNMVETTNREAIKQKIEPPRRNNL